MNSNVVYVLSGTYREFMRELYGKPSHRYISSINTLIGTRGCRYIRMGTWNERPDINSILLMMRLNDMIDITDGGQPKSPETEDDEYLYRIGYNQK